MAMAGAVWVDVLPNMKGFAPALQRQTTESGRAAGASFGKAMSVGLIAAVAGGAVATKALFAIGETFKGVERTIIVGTGAAGKSLDSLNASARNIGKSTPSSFRDVGTAVADLNTRLGLTGKPLEDMSARFLNLSRLTGTSVSTNIAQVTRVFGDWSISMKDQPVALDKIFEATKRTGIGLDRLSTLTVQYGAPLRQLGFSFEQTLALFGNFEKAGVNTETVFAGLRVGLGKMAKAGEEPVDTFKRVVQGIKDAGSAGPANALALEAFGQRAGPDMAAAIREGRFEIDDLVAGLANSAGAIDDADKRTRTWSDTWQLIKNNVLVGLEPLANKVFIAVEKGMNFIANVGVPALKKLAHWLERNGAWLAPLAAGIGAVTGTLVTYAAVMKVVAVATKAWAAAQALLNLVMAANPFVLVAALVIGLSVAFIVAYKKSETFRNAIGEAWKFIKNAFITGIQFITGAFLGFVSMLLNGAAKAFQFVPGLGPKLQKAAAEFDQFKDRVNESLERIKDKDVTVGIKLDQGAQDAIKAFGKKNVILKDGHVAGIRRGPGGYFTAAQGGPIGRGVGTHDEVPLLAMRGEHMWTTREVQAIGGHTAMYRLREAALAGALPGFARGGPVGMRTATDFPNASALRALRAEFAAGRDVIADGVGSLTQAGLSRAIGLTIKASGAVPSYDGRTAFPLPRGSYRVGVPLYGYPGHTGQDFPAATGTPVFAPFTGQFTPVRLGNRSYGNYANVLAGNMRFIGAHLSAFARGAGLVRAGDMIGRVGSTGNSTGPHLHAEFRRNGAVLNPRSILSFDRGGQLPPGLHLTYNGTGRPETVLSPSGGGGTSGGGGGRAPLTVNVNVEPRQRRAGYEIGDAIANTVVLHGWA